MEKRCPCKSREEALYATAERKRLLIVELAVDVCIGVWADDMGDE